VYKRKKKKKKDGQPKDRACEQLCVRLEQQQQQQQQQQTERICTLQCTPIHSRLLTQ
jgi:hypothetical protein